jgi:hemerythrin
MRRDIFHPNSFGPQNAVDNAVDNELLGLLNGLAGDAAQGLAPEIFSEKLDRLGQLLSMHVSSEEQHSGASCLSVSCSQSHIQEHNLMLEQYVQWQFELMKMNASPRAEICRKIKEWLACHVFVPRTGADVGPER